VSTQKRSEVVSHPAIRIIEYSPREFWTRTDVINGFALRCGVDIETIAESAAEHSIGHSPTSNAVSFSIRNSDGIYTRYATSAAVNNAGPDARRITPGSHPGLRKNQ